ncbi:glycoside hydrolase family 127 protein [Colwellia sp. E2M01]|uniref:glycoside hydrolase family 127 protein n=1 Tax=Colwellia sp. E2M01 TaxID=2841561 RepID=UPI001C08EF55|nr:glycoside hydrolase family 127 protein [Colwellia sp. E2M01]
MSSVPFSTHFSVPFSISESHNLSRSAQPISMGCPFGVGIFFTDTPLAISQKDGQLISCQISPLTYWHDGSIKWAMIDFVVDIKANETLALTLTDNFAKTDLLASQHSITISKSTHQLEINTGLATFFINTAQGKPLTLVSAALSETGDNKKPPLTIELTDPTNEKHQALVDKVNIDTNISASHRKTVNITGSFNDESNNGVGVLFEATLTFFANSSYIKSELTIHNPQAAMHPGGLWDLGDEGSILFKSLNVNIPVDSNGTVNIYDHITNKSVTCGENASIQQFSSGGVNWQSPIHKNAAGKVEIEKNGFEITSTSAAYHELEESKGLRISPAFSVCNTNVNDTENTLSVYVEKFWQNFPKAIAKQNDVLSVALFPEGNFELQGGEKKTHSLWVDFVSTEQNFAWLDKPLNISIAPKYIEKTAAFDLFVADLKRDELAKIIEKGVHGENNFFAKREAVDEFGWRNFGDLYADHETEGYTGNETFVSHYNNQYDPIYGFVYQYLAHGNTDYLELANDLTKHVADIDIYHTVDDKDEYNGGLFWHTDHYLDASTATHRTFSKNHSAVYEGYTSGGGPGGQHCYTTGLKNYYQLTGNENAKKAVLQLADWITYYYEGSNSFLAKLFAIKQSNIHDLKDHISEQYPLDRGTGHYVIALLDAYDLTQSESYLTKAFKVICHTFHPEDDISLRNFDNIEETWFYTVFLQAVGRFLLIKERNSQLDDDFYYARDAMLHYANWMLDNELPYLTQAEKLEFPNTTWAGQDLRKVGIFYMANYYLPASNVSNKSTLFLEKATYFKQHIVQKLQSDANNDYTRVLVLLMQNSGFADYYQQAVSKNKFENIKEYAKPAKVNKYLKVASLLCKELSRLSIKNEIKWLSLRSAKVAKLLGKKS